MKKLNVRKSFVHGNSEDEDQKENASHGNHMIMRRRKKASESIAVEVLEKLCRVWLIERDFTLIDLAIIRGWSLE